jgi:CRP-like cAMP-binding protein
MKVALNATPVNRLIGILPERSRKRLLGSCEQVHLTFGEVLCAAGDAVEHVYFPQESFISLLATLDDGERLEIGILGDEGMLGASVHLGVNRASEQAVVQGPGAALRISARNFRWHCKQDPALREGMNRYVYLLMAQFAQTAACAHYHLIQARLARWLLLTRDRAHSNRFRLTHELLAHMLGVRRVGITEAAMALHERGFIDYARGEIVIRNGRGLEQASCGCYAQSNEIYESLLGTAQADASSHS